MNWYKLAQQNEPNPPLSQFQLKQLISKLNQQLIPLEQKKWSNPINNPLTTQENTQFNTIKNKINYLSDILQNNIDQQKINTEQLISQNKEHQVSPSNFLQYHYTGHIPENTYEKYQSKENLQWLGNINKYPLLVKSHKYNNEIIEFRKTNEPLKYVKHNQNNDILRNEEGEPIYLSLKEMQQKNLPTHETSIVAFNQNKEPIGWASNEFGADGVWIIKDYQNLGIGTDLLHEFRKQFPPKRKIGQMTPQGISLTKKYHKKLILDALKQGKYVPQDILDEYNIK